MDLGNLRIVVNLEQSAKRRGFRQAANRLEDRQAENRNGISYKYAAKCRRFLVRLRTFAVSGQLRTVVILGRLHTVVDLGKLRTVVVLRTLRTTGLVARSAA